MTWTPVEHPAQPGGSRLLPALVEVVPHEALDPQHGQLVVLVSPVVRVDLTPTLVKGAAVELDHEALLRVEAVDLVVGHPHVEARRPRQAVPAHGAQKPSLELGLRVGLVGVEQARDDAAAGAVRRAVLRRPELRGREPAQGVDRRADLVPPGDVGEVDHAAGDAGHAQEPSGADVDLVEASHPVHHHAGA